MDLRDVANYGGFAVGVIGILLSFYWFKRSLESKEPRCFYRTYRDIQKLSANGEGTIRIFYKSEEVDRVFTTYVWFWNRGRKPLNKSDIPPQSGIRLRLLDDKHPPHILDYRVVKTSREAINFTVTSGGQDFLTVEFDFLDHNDGAVVEIQHTGSNETQLQAEGVILGVPKGIKVISRAVESSFERFLRMPLFLMAEDMRPRHEIRARLGRSVFYWGMVAAMAAMAGWFLHYELTMPTRVVSSVDKLQQILTTELPQLSEQSFQRIVAEMTKESQSDPILTYLALFYLAILLGVMSLAAWHVSTLPFPKSLYIESTEQKPSASRK